MRGLRLFVRPIEPADDDVVREFLARNRERAIPSPPSEPAAAWGLLGKLLGDVVAVASLVSDGKELHVEEIVVARELRRKRIGRAMIREAATLAAKLDLHRLVIDDCSLPEFCRRVGFEQEGDRWVLAVRQPSPSAER